MEPLTQIYRHTTVKDLIHHKWTFLLLTMQKGFFLVNVACLRRKPNVCFKENKIILVTLSNEKSLHFDQFQPQKTYFQRSISVKVQFLLILN